MKGMSVVLKGTPCLGMAFLLSGCLVEMLMSTAVTADMAAQNAGEIQGTFTDAQVDIDMVRLQEAVDLYATEKEAFPADLSALAPAYIDAVPLRPDKKPYGYNPIEGEVYKTSDGPATADYFTMQKIEMAINSFGTNTGYYPPTLDALYPTYIPTLPRTASGKPFNYNNQDGQVSHPDEGKQHGPAEIAVDSSASAASEPVKPVNAIGSLDKGDLKDSNSLNKALDRMGY